MSEERRDDSERIVDQCEGEDSSRTEDVVSGRSNDFPIEKTETTAKSTSSLPIDIRQAASGKFGVLHARQPSPPQTMLDSNGEPISIDKLIKTANTMSSMMMAHKIALEDDFKLEPGMDISGPLMSLSPIIGSSPTTTSNEPTLHSRVRDMVLEAFWDLFREELKSQDSENKEERKYDQSKQLLCDIKQKIIELLLPQHARLKQDVEEKLDAKIIEQLTKCDSLNLIDYGAYVLSVLAKLCAPVRDEKLRELSELIEQKDVVQLYRGIMELLELMRLDFANFTLNSFKPHIKAHSHDYERDKFNEILRQQKNIGIDGLEYTRIWLDRAVKKLDAIHGIADLVHSEESNSVELEDFSTSGASDDSKIAAILRSDVVNKTLSLAFCELLEWNPRTQKLYPETLLFDEATFRSLGEQYKVLLLTSSVLLTTFAFLKNLKLNEDQEFKVLLKSHVITLLTATYDRSSTESNPISNEQSTSASSTSSVKHSDPVDQIKLETIAAKLCDDIKRKVTSTDKSLLGVFDSQCELLRRQISDLQTSSNRIKDLSRRRILEFVETLLDLDVKHQQKKFSSKVPPPVNIPLGLNCLTDELTSTMAQLVKIIRYNRRVFFQHYQDIIVDIVAKIIK